MLSASERRVLEMFHEYLMAPGKMLCFSGLILDRHLAALNGMVVRKLLVREKFKGVYSLTRTGFEVMKQCLDKSDDRSS